jgi:hypothetical protein
MPEPEGLSAALPQISEHSGRIAAIDEREGSHFREVGGCLADLRTLVDAMRGALTDQADILAAVQRLDEQVTTLTSRVEEIAPDEDGAAPTYRPIPSPRWWSLDDDAREQALRNCAPGSTRSTGRPTATSPPASGAAGTSTPSA